MAVWACCVVVCAAVAGCTSAKKAIPHREAIEERAGDEIVVAGEMFHTGAPVVLWSDPGGYNAYINAPAFARPGDGASNTEPRYDTRLSRGVPVTEAEDLRAFVDQFVLHYDVAGTSRSCFRVLHDMRGLSVHFLLDLDGTIYQTLDVRERAWHATKANHRSVGIEIANIGAYPSPDARPLESWYATGPDGRTLITLPGYVGDGGIREPKLAQRPSRSLPVAGEIHGQTFYMYDLTDAQYDSLIKLTHALHRALPAIELDYPRDTAGGVLPRTLTEPEFEGFRGVLGHWHVQRNKIDPGPAFDWERLIHGARARGWSGDGGGPVGEDL